MENYDDDFSTLKGLPSHFSRATRPLNQWKSDIPLADGDATLRGEKKASVFVDDFDDDDEFASELESAVRDRNSPRRSVENLPEAFLSDSSSKSASRASVSSTTSLSSASSVPTSWDQDDDFGFDFEDNDIQDPKVELATRFKLRQQRAQIEAANEALKLAQATKAKKKLRFNQAHPFRDSENEDDDEILGLDLEQLTLRVKNGTVNRNVRCVQTPQTPQTQSKMLRGMRSIAQLPNQRPERPEASPLRLRAAQSMLDLGRGPAPTRQRPLTAYKEPQKKSSQPSILREKPKSKSKHPNLIQNPTQTLTRQVRNGMVLNPATGMWEGNDVDSARFENPVDVARPTLIPKERIDHQQLQNNGMVFDSRTLVWVHANEEEYDDPFAGIDEPLAMKSDHPYRAPSTVEPSTPRYGSSMRHFTNESLASSASSTSAASTAQFARSVTRPESSGREVFEVSNKLAMEWRHADERFMRKFGKWIGGDEERADAMNSDQHFYEMVRNT